MGRFTCLQEGIYRIRLQVRKGVVPFTANLYALPGDDGLLFDAGFGTRGAIAHLASALEAIEAEGEGRVREVMPSHAHWDHFSGVRPIADKRRMRVRLTEKMVPLIRTKAAFRQAYLADFKETPGGSALKKYLGKIPRRLGDEFYAAVMGIKAVTGPYTPISVGDCLSLASGRWEVLAGPGHCDVHVMLWNKERGVLLGGDNVLADITTWLGPPRSDIDAYESTLKMIRDLPGLKVIYPAHGGPVEDPIRRVTDILAHRKKRMDEIRMEVFRAGRRGVSAEGIVSRYYPRINAFRKGIARGWIDTTLVYLMREGTLRRYAENGVWRYQMKDL